MLRKGDPKKAKAVTINGDVGPNAQFNDTAFVRNSTILWAQAAGNVALTMDDGVAIVFGAQVGENRYPPFSHVRETSTTATGIVVGIAW